MTPFVCLKFVVLLFLFSLPGYISIRGEDILCKKSASIRALASVETPLGMLTPSDYRAQFEEGSDFLTFYDAYLYRSQPYFLLYQGQGEVVLRWDNGNSIKTLCLDPDDSKFKPAVIDIGDRATIKLVDIELLFGPVDTARTLTISVIYSAN